MPLPLFLGIVVALAGAGGAAATIKGGLDTKKAHDTMASAKRQNERNLARFTDAERTVKYKMETLGKLEMDTAKDFQRFSGAFEKIQNRPEFDTINSNVKIPSFDFNEIRTVSVAAGAFLGAAAGGATGAVFGTAAAAGTTAAVMALGTASTGTAIATLSGAAATNAALAAIGGGAVAAGGGGIALGTTLLTASTLGVGLLVGGAIFAFTGLKIKEKADEAYRAMLQNEREIDKNVSYLSRITVAAEKLKSAIEKVARIYDANVRQLILLVDRETDWDCYSDDERLLVKNTTRIVAVLHKLINTPLLRVTKTDSQGSPLETDLDAQTVELVINNANSSLAEIGLDEKFNISAITRLVGGDLARQAGAYSSKYDVIELLGRELHKVKHKKEEAIYTRPNPIMREVYQEQAVRINKAIQILRQSPNIFGGTPGGNISATNQKTTEEILAEINGRK